MLAAGLISVALRDRRWAVADAAIIGGLAGVAALFFFSESRAGVVILIAGVGLWLAGLGGRHRPGQLLLATAVAGVAAGGLFLAFESTARDRLLETAGVHQSGGGRKPTPEPATATATATGNADGAGGSAGAGRTPADPPAEFRMAIYRDTLDMIRDQPWTGTGLGTFAGVFPQYRRASLVPFNAVHPESDWLMLRRRPGCRRWRARRRSRGWRRGACGVGGASVLAAAVGIRGGGGGGAAARSGGRAGAPGGGGVVTLALAGLALQRPRQEAEGKRPTAAGGVWPERAQRAVFVLGGAAALALGGMLARAEWLGGPALAPFAAETTPRQMFDAYQRKEYAAGAALARRTRQDAPLTPAAYYYLGIFLAVSDEEGVDQQVDEMFQAERTLDPVMPDVPRRQAMAWAGYDPARQAALMMNELGRTGRINRAVGFPASADLLQYQNMVSNARAQPDLQRYLLAVARPDPRFEAMWTQGTGPVLAQARVDRLAADAAAASGDGAARPDWYLQPENAGPVLPVAAPAADAEWLNAGWPVRLRQMVYAGQYQRAAEALARRYGISLALPGEPGAEDGTEPGGAAGAFAAAWRAGDQTGARRGFAAADGDADDPAALEAWRWRAALAARDGNWKERGSRWSGTRGTRGRRSGLERNGTSRYAPRRGEDAGYFREPGLICLPRAVGQPRATAV